MNFLAHLYFDHEDADAMIGALLPDLAPGRWRRLEALPATIADAAQRHRRIDRLTDAHPLVARSKQRIFAQQGRFSGILIDVYYDHLLSRSWSRYHDQPLAAFIARCYGLLAGAMRRMPPPMRPAIARMIEQDWLSAYATDAGLRRIVSMLAWRLTQRFGRTMVLDGAVAELAGHRRALADDFHAFFPDLIESMSRDGAAASGDV